MTPRAANQKDVTMPNNKPDLTAREAALLRGVVANKTFPEIAAGLGLSPETIKKEAARLKLKLGVDGKVGLALWAKTNMKGV